MLSHVFCFPSNHLNYLRLPLSLSQLRNVSRDTELALGFQEPVSLYPRSITQDGIFVPRVVARHTTSYIKSFQVMIPLFSALIDTTISSSSYSSDSSSPSRTPSASTAISTSKSSPPSESPQLGSSRGLLYFGLKGQHLIVFRQLVLQAKKTNTEKSHKHQVKPF